MRAHHVLACSAVAMGVVFSCGPFVPQAIFTAGERPRIPINEYAAGKLGVIQPAFEDEYLIIAYRTVSGRPLTAREQSSLQSIVSKEQPVADWLAERRRVIADETKTVEQYRAVPGDKWQTYLNCPDDAFRNAARTLRARIGQFGAAAATGWVKAQDRVFQNCAAGTSIPEATESGTPAIIAADREYQIAAAHFYSEQFDAARTRFSAIAGDTSSPWHEIAPYLVARAWLREATLSGDRTKLERAVQELRRVGASRLANFAELRLDPGARLREVELELLDPAKGDFGEKLAEWNYARRKGAILRASSASGSRR